MVSKIKSDEIEASTSGASVDFNSAIRPLTKTTTQMNAMTAMGKNGPYTLPMMSQVYKLQTVREQNDKGKWFGWLITKERQIDLSDAFEKGLFDNAVAFAKSVEAGEVDVKEAVPDTPTETTAMPKKTDKPKTQQTNDDDPF